MLERIKTILQNQIARYSIIFLIGVIITSVYFLVKVRILQSKINYQNQQEEQLNTQIKKLSDTYRKPRSSPTPTISNPATAVFQLKDETTYSIECFDFTQKKSDLSYLSDIEKKLTKTEKISYLCFNSKLNKAVFMTNDDNVPNRNKRTTSYIIKIKIFDLATSKIKDLVVTAGNWLGGCGKITSWSQNGFIYYQCGGGDGPWATLTTEQVSANGGFEGIVEHCSVFGDKKYCSRYCDQLHSCQTGSFCNLEQNNCIQYCQDHNNCVNGGNGGYEACRPYGPVMGCRL